MKFSSALQFAASPVLSLFMLASSPAAAGQHRPGELSCKDVLNGEEGAHGLSQRLKPEPVAITAGDKRFDLNIEVANTKAQWETGMMFRTDLPKDSGGMLFVGQPIKEPFSMWMRDTYIPLDILFLNGKGEIIGSALNTQPCNEQRIWAPKKQGVAAVLELPAGMAQKLGLQLNDIVHHATFGNALPPPKPPAAQPAPATAAPPPATPKAP